MEPAGLWSVHFISEAGRLAYADRGVYMLCRTSNPGGADYQDLVLQDGRTVYEHTAMATPPEAMAVARLVHSNPINPGTKAGLAAEAMNRAEHP